MSITQPSNSCQRKTDVSKQTFQNRRFTCYVDFQTDRRQRVSCGTGRRRRGREDSTEICDLFYPLKNKKKELSVFEYETCYFKNHHLLHKTKAQTEIMFELLFKSNKTFLQLLIITNIPVTCFNLANCLRHLLQRSTAQVDFSECHPCLGLISTEKVSPNVFFKYSEVCQRK